VEEGGVAVDEVYFLLGWWCVFVFGVVVDLVLYV